MLFALPFVVVLAAVFSRILYHPNFVNLDAAMYLNCGQLILQGKLPYVDFIDTNPPLILYLSVLPVVISKVFRTSLLLTASFCTFIFILYSIAASFIVLRKKVRTKEWQILLPVLFGCALFNLLVFFHFGQREHILVLSFMPFFFMRWLRRDNQQFSVVTSVAVGILAGIGICLKPPYFLLVPAAIELYWFAVSGKIWQRLKDPEMLAATLVGLSYMAILFGLMPCVIRETFFTRWMPLFVVGRAAYAFPVWQSLLLVRHPGPGQGEMLPLPWMVALVCIVAILLRKKSSLVMPFLLWTLSGYVIYVIQGCLWAYHSIVMMVGYFSLMNLELAILAQSICQRQYFFVRKLQTLISMKASVFTVYGITLFMLLPITINDSFVTGFNFRTITPAILKYTRLRDPILIISAFISPAYPSLVQTDRRPASRYLWTYPLKMCEYLKQNEKNNIEKQKYNNEENRIMGEVHQDIIQNAPTLIAVAWTNHIWDVWSIENLQESEFPVPVFENDLGWNHRWSMFSCLQSYGFENMITEYRPIGFCDDSFIWVRRTH